MLLTSCASSGQIKIGDIVKVLDQGTSLSTDEIGKGLKEALDKGTGHATDVLSLRDGYFKSELYKILLPQEARSVVDKVKMVPGFQDADVKLIELCNRAAEDAATKAKPIFINAIKQMTISDAMNILMGDKDAATRYLERTTGTALYNEFQPVIKNSLNTVHAAEYWQQCAQAYNSIPFVSKVNASLDDHVTKMALKGLFGKVAEEELSIRTNLSHRTSDLLKKVFSKQDKK
jgi:hypothetical protein